VEPSSRCTAFLEAVVIDRRDDAAESMSPPIRRIKRIAFRSRDRRRLCDAILAHPAMLDLHPRPVSALTTSSGTADLLSERCSTESDISRIGRTARDPRDGSFGGTFDGGCDGARDVDTDMNRQRTPERPPRTDGCSSEWS
jgi:hypothetical protein